MLGDAFGPAARPVVSRPALGGLPHPARGSDIATLCSAKAGRCPCRGIPPRAVRLVSRHGAFDRGVMSAPRGQGRYRGCRRHARATESGLVSEWKVIFHSPHPGAAGSSRPRLYWPVSASVCSRSGTHGAGRPRPGPRAGWRLAPLGANKPRPHRCHASRCPDAARRGESRRRTPRGYAANVPRPGSGGGPSTRGARSPGHCQVELLGGQGLFKVGERHNGALLR